MKKRYIISTIVPGDKPNLKFIKSLEHYCKVNKNTKIYFIPSKSLYSEDTIHPYFQKSKSLLLKDISLNNNIYISLIPINPQAIDPITGLDRQTQIDGSVIFASPKQRMKSVASPNSDFPRVIMTPGAATLPKYANTRAGIIAKKDHVNGAIIVEIENSSIYHFRQIQAAKDGSFVDLGVRYHSNKIKMERLEALTPGDWHCGFTDPLVKNVVFEIAKEMKPKHLILHDFFDGISINHHMEHKLLEKAMMNKHSDLGAELQQAAIELKVLEKLADAIVVVKSNHDEFLDRWLSEGKYINDRQNHILGLELALAKAMGKDPLEYGLNRYQQFTKVKFLKCDESFKLTKREIENGVHGHRGPNGARGGSAGVERSYGAATTGHTHSPEILRGLFVVGTSTYHQLGYNTGPSSWMQTMCLTYQDGSRQLVNVIRGKWRI